MIGQKSRRPKNWKLFRKSFFDFGRLSVKQLWYALHCYLYSKLCLQRLGNGQNASRKSFSNTHAKLDCHHANIMFRANADKTYSPVMIDPLAYGARYDKISPRYRKWGILNREAFIWKLANRLPSPLAPAQAPTIPIPRSRRVSRPLPRLKTNQAFSSC